MKNEFFAVFQLSKTKIFNVAYYRCGANKDPYFTTSAAVFQKGKRDYNRCGQCQEAVCKGYDTARNFYKKWDVLHLRDLTDEQYTEMKNDLNKLFEVYNFLYSEERKNCFGFEAIKELSKMKPKKV